MGHPVYGASFSPDHLATLRQAFDHAWAAVEKSVGAADKEVTRDKLASIVVMLGEQGVMQCELLALTAKRLLRREAAPGREKAVSSEGPSRSRAS